MSHRPERRPPLVLGTGRGVVARTVLDTGQVADPGTVPDTGQVPASMSAPAHGIVHDPRPQRAGLGGSVGLHFFGERRPQPVPKPQARAFPSAERISVVATIPERNRSTRMFSFGAWLRSSALAYGTISEARPSVCVNT